MRVTRPRATKISQITIDADLDLKTFKLITDTVAEKTVTHGVDVDGVNLKDGFVDKAYIDDSLLKWVLLDSYEDTNDGTVFSYDSGTVTSYDLYKIVVIIANHFTGDNVAQIRVNNISAANYLQNYVGSGTVGQITNRTGWEITLNDDEGILIEAILRGKYATNPTTQRPTISALCAMGSGTNALLNGMLIQDHPTVTRFSILTPNNASGHLNLFGMNLG